MGQPWSDSPALSAARRERYSQLVCVLPTYGVAVQVAFESENFETRISLYRLKSRVEETRRFNKLWVKLDSVLVQPSPTMLINTAL